MSTLIRPELSKENPYYISKHRYYELKHFCLQYHEWKELYLSLDVYNREKTENYTDPTPHLAMVKIECERNIHLVERVAKETDESLAKYIFKAVTEDDISFTYLKTVMNIPCGKDMYYDRYRRFFWLLDKERQ